MANNERPEGCYHYAESADGKYRFIAWRPPAEPDGDLTLAIIGRTRARLVQDILDGRYNHLVKRGEGA